MLEPIFNNVAGLHEGNTLTPAQIFSCEFCGILTPFLQNTTVQLLLHLRFQKFTSVLTPAEVFSVNFKKFLRTRILRNICERLLL